MKQFGFNTSYLPVPVPISAHTPGQPLYFPPHVNRSQPLGAFCPPKQVSPVSNLRQKMRSSTIYLPQNGRFEKWKHQNH